MFELVAAWLTAVAALTTPLAHAPADSAKNVTSGRTNLTAQQADNALAATGQAVKADAKVWRWECSLPMVITPAAGTGVTDAEIRQQLAYPVEYLRSLGYNVTVGPAVAYKRDMEAAEQVGQVIIAVTDKPSEQRELDGAAARTLPNRSGSDAVAATIVVNADPKTGELAGDILLHELGHVLGLDHKAGTVMDTSWNAPIGFDAAEVAAVDCR